MKKMMKNKKLVMILAMVLMVTLVIGMGAMTYARYVSSYEVPTHSATAAKWGFVVGVETADLFATEYDEADDDTYATVDETGNIVVKASSTANIVAPGTTGYLLIETEGVAEVKAKMTIDITVAKTISDGAGYNPIQWALVKSGTAPVDGDWTTVAAGGKITKVFDLDAGTQAPGNYELHWRWAFTTSTENDQKDTAIGMKSKDATVSAATVATATGMTIDDEALAKYTTAIEFSGTVKVEQVQE